ncbi:hypothetical protein V6N11_082043 [Hibiscus sabdariffa]|uniref:Uncharacterized protein n=1 Tax=Hibiscus sabdariffa TaxID=183260 RepID=A0ABR2QGR8_9ROSI
MRSKPSGPCLNLSPGSQPSPSCWALLNAPTRSKLSRIRQMRKWLKKSEEESSWTTEEEDRAKAPFPSALPEAKSPPPYKSQSSDGTWNHTAAAALRARLLHLPVTYALAACPLRAIRLSYLLDSEFVPTSATREILIVFLPVLLPAGGRKVGFPTRAGEGQTLGLGRLPGFAYATVSQD